MVSSMFFISESDRNRRCTGLWSKDSQYKSRRRASEIPHDICLQISVTRISDVRHNQSDNLKTANSVTISGDTGQETHEVVQPVRGSGEGYTVRSDAERELLCGDDPTKDVNFVRPDSREEGIEGAYHPRGPHEAAKPAMNQQEAKMRPFPAAGSLGSAKAQNKSEAAHRNNSAGSTYWQQREHRR